MQQEPPIFNLSVLQNICYGAPHATAEEVEQAAELANATEFIHALAKTDKLESFSAESDEDESDDDRYNQLDPGFRASCGVKGSQLSGGQKQRVAIARAIVRQPAVMLLDEATSALDEGSQAAVQEALMKVMDRKTAIVVAHRTSTLKDCDKIVIMAKGKIADKGTYREMQKYFID